MEVTSERLVEEQVERLLSGQGSEVSICDVGVEQSKPAALRKNITYIVGAVIFNEKATGERSLLLLLLRMLTHLCVLLQEEVLMVQEAKPDCYKQWYLPAGRVEVGESLEEALRREVKEEAGFYCEPITMLLIQEQGPQWIRFIFLARVSGGSLKSLDAADQESLQAAWWDRQTPLPLRGRDILRLIEHGLKYHRNPWHPVTLPVDLSCRHVVQRMVLVFVGAEDQIWILLVRASVPHLPTAAAVKTHAVTWAANMVVQDAMPASYYDHDVTTLGVFGLQHNGRQHGRTDGICLNTLVALVPDRVQRDEDGMKVELPPAGRPPPIENSRYLWFQVQNPDLRDKLLEKTKSTSLLPIHSLY